MIDLFQNGRKRRPKKEKPLWFWILFPLLSFSIALALVLWGLGAMGAAASEERLALMEKSILRRAVQCYALEGAYPGDLSYLVDQYGLLLNEERYIYHYRYLGDNLMPQITVFSKR